MEAVNRILEQEDKIVSLLKAKDGKDIGCPRYPKRRAFLVCYE